MRKVRIWAVIAASAVSMSAAGGAWAASGGDRNAGDVWVDNVGEPSGPGHEMDPHLACANINLWGAGLADASGSFTIDGWPPSGSKTQAYAASWNYGGGHQAQVTAVIDVQQLVAAAVANGDAPVNGQGYHFKLQFSQDPQKHKTFWVKCPAPVPPSSDGTPPPSGTPNTPTGSTPAVVTTPPPATKTVLGVAIQRSGKKHKHHKHHLLKPKRHHRAHHRAIHKRVHAIAVFTG
jgi:hypothetical protein